MLEVKRDLTLSTLKTILRGHYKVDSSSDLLYRLMNISQEPRESAQDFLFRAIELREKLLWKSGDEDEGEQFSSDLIQRKFLRSLETGLLSEAVKFQLKPYLSNSRVIDEVLIEKMNEAASLELERQNKLRRTTTVKPPIINEIHTEIQVNSSQLPPHSEIDTNDETQTKVGGAASTKKKQGQNKGPDPETVKLIADLRADVLEVKKMFNDTLETTKSRPSTDTRPSPAARWARGCQRCREAEAGDTCRHCSRCGQEGHLSCGCRQSRFMQGNEKGVAESGPTVALPSSRSQVNMVSPHNTHSHARNPPSDHTDTPPAIPQPPSSKYQSDTHANYVPSQRQNKLISLIGRRCMVQCHLDNVPTEAL